jgi:glutathione S-transferase
MACTLYIARHHGQADGASITPATPREDAEALRWSFWAVTEVEKDALTVLMHRLVMPAEDRKHDLAEAAEKRLAVPLRVLEQHLTQQQARNEAHLAAARFTVADLVAQFPLVSAWLAHCLERPAYEQLRRQR